MNEPASAFVQILKQLVQLLGLCLGAPYLHFNGFCHNWWAVLLLFENSVLIFSTATQICSTHERWILSSANKGVHQKELYGTPSVSKAFLLDRRFI
jgi:hypothetical protein